jgi:16S rRNA (adenine1518-N6/adenine1519-N6)-dimethyltransferase
MSPTLAEVTRQLLESYNRYPRKNLGQHFLIDPQVLKRIIKAAELSKDDLVIEIGSGLGVVTAEIAQAAGQVIAVEIDKELAQISRTVLKDLSNVTVISQDFLTTRLEAETGRRHKIIGNLPYYITAPIIEKILTAPNKAQVAVLMVQKEVAERMAAKPGTKKYSSFSVFCQYHASISVISLVSKSSFHPWPEVSSAIVSLIPYPAPQFPDLNEKLFFDIVHAAFQQRRKQLKNSLKNYNLEKAGIDLSRRPETVSVAEFARLSNCFTPNS